MDELLLWPHPAPLARGNAPEDTPTLTPYLPEPSKRNGTSILVLPGGGYAHLAAHEGEGYAKWLAELGICAYVLKYRLGSNGYRHPAMLQDAGRALRTVRHFAREQRLALDRVGVIGSSAGGHLTATLVTRFADVPIDPDDPIDVESARPDFGILCYPVITFGEFTHQGSRTQLLGADATEAQWRDLSAELNVTEKTPPCFLWHTFEDGAVPVENSLLFAGALRRAKVPFDLHVYEHGGHGLGLGRPEKPAPPWASQCEFWLRSRNILT